MNSVDGRAVNKTILRDRFARRLATYSHEAIVQKRIASILSQKISTAVPHPLKCVLEVGCGTGFLTRKLLRHGVQTLFLNDLVEEAIPSLGQQLRQDDFCGELEFLPGDAENIALPHGLDAIVSSSAMQWFADFPHFLQRSRQALKDGGWLIFSHFGPRNLHQIRTLTGMGLDYPEPACLQEMLNRDYEILTLEEEKYQQAFSTPREVLRHLQQTGVTGMRNTSFRWTKQRLQDFETTYAALYGQGNKVLLTWHVYYVVCKKRF